MAACSIHAHPAALDERRKFPTKINQTDFVSLNAWKSDHAKFFFESREELNFPKNNSEELEKELVNEDIIHLQHAHITQYSDINGAGPWHVRKNITNEDLAELPSDLTEAEVFTVMDFARKYELIAVVFYYFFSAFPYFFSDSVIVRSITHCY